MKPYYSQELKKRFILMGYDPDQPHYGLVESYDPEEWTGYGHSGRGRIRVYKHYAAGKKWCGITVYSQNLEPNQFANNVTTLRPGDMVTLELAWGPNGVTGLNVRAIREKQKESSVERAVTKAQNLIRASAPLITDPCDAMDFFGGALPPMPVATETLPHIQKAPKNE